RAPSQLAICTAACPTLPLTPITSTVSSLFGIPARRKPSIAVTKGTPIPAASSHDRFFGFSTTASTSTARCVAWVPSRRIPRSPEEPNTSRPIEPAGPSRKYRVGHQAGGGFDVGRIHRRRPDFDQNLVRGPRQRTPLDSWCERSRIVGLRRQTHAARLDGNRRPVWFFGG